MKHKIQRTMIDRTLKGLKRVKEKEKIKIKKKSKSNKKFKEEKIINKKLN